VLQGDEYLYTSPTGNQYFFHSSSAPAHAYRVKAIEYRGGYRVDYDWGSPTANTLVVTDSFNRSHTLAYRFTQNLGSENKILIDRLTDPAGRITSFQYNDHDMVTQVVYPDGSSRDYQYADTDDYEVNNLIQITDESGTAYAQWAYDDNHRGVLSSHAAGAEQVSVEFHESAAPGRVVNSTVTQHRTATDVQKVDYEFTRLNGVLKPTRVSTQPCPDCTVGHTEFEYDRNGLLAQQTSPAGRVTGYSYNTNGRLNTITDALGTDQARTSFVFWHHSFPGLVSQTYGPGFSYRYTYDSLGNKIKESINQRETHYSYNTLGQVLSIDGPRTDVQDITHFTYGANGNLIRVTNALGHDTNITQHDAYGRPTRVVDPNGLVSELTYNVRGWLTSSTTHQDQTLYQYNSVGLLTQLTLPNAVVLDYQYDGARRLTSITDGLGNRIDYTIDAYGNRTRTELSDPNGSVRSHVDHAFNNLNQLISSTGANLQQQRWGYDADGNVIEREDALGHRTQTQFDALNRVIGQIDPDQHSSQFEYDQFQQTSKVVDALGRETTYTRDVQGNVIRQESPDTGKQSFTYDFANNLKTATDARGVVRMRPWWWAVVSQIQALAV